MPKHAHKLKIRHVSAHKIFKKLFLEILLTRVVKSKVASVVRFLQKILVKELIFGRFSSLVALTVNYLISIFHGF